MRDRRCVPLAAAVGRGPPGLASVCQRTYCSVHTPRIKQRRDELGEVVMSAVTKDARLNLRLKPKDDQLIKQAAQSLGVSVSEFLTSSAVARAHELLAGQRQFFLDEDTWDAFVALLDGPARPDPRLVELFARPQRIRR